MNDYEQCADDCRTAALDIEGINAPDPDIEELVEQAAGKLREAAKLSEERQ